LSRVLFCEDDPAIHKLIRMAMRNSDHEVTMASNGVEGLRLARELLPSVVFSDVSMPDMNGFELAGALRADPQLAKIPIVFITASVQRADVEEAMRYGAARVIGKPFTVSELRDVVAEFA
jgi:CheY-like chemotaxis protein